MADRAVDWKADRTQSGGGGLASARDRARLQARQVAERARIERALAKGPRGPEVVREPERSGAGRALANALRAGEATTRGGAAAPQVACRLCGGLDVIEDQVAERGTWRRLACCRRCDHRWTERVAMAAGFAPRVRRPPAWRGGQEASAGA